MMRSAGLVLSGNLVGAIVMMARTLLVSRLIPVEDFGIASCFVLALALVDMATALGLQQQMMQDRRGNDPAFQAALHGLCVLRGTVAALILLALAYPMAWFFDVMQALWAFYLIALAPLLSGLAHLDPHRLVRQQRFGPGVVVATVPSVISLMAVLPLSHLFGDYRVLLFSILIQLGLAVITSHLVARRPYRLRMNRAVTQAALRFGAPIMLSGALMFLVFNAERAIISNSMGLVPLAHFSLALSLTLAPALVASRSMMNLFLPRLSAGADRHGFQTLLLASFQGHLILGVALMVGVAILGGPFIQLVLGAKYDAAILLLAGLALLQSFRVFEGGFAVTALAIGRPMNEVFANLVRVALLPVAWIIVARGGDLHDVIVVGTLGEAAGFSIGLVLMIRQNRPPLGPLLASLGFAAVTLGFSYVAAQEMTWEKAIGLVVMLGAMVRAQHAFTGHLRSRGAGAVLSPGVTDA